MQFIRSRIAAPRPSESRSVALWKQLGWFSASKTYTTSQQPHCASADQSKLFSAGNSIKASSALLWTCLMVARLFGQLTIYGCRIEARGTKFCTSLMFRG
jgi:hypothetical protein